MKTSDKIIIEELKLIVKMQAQENRLLKAKINYLEQELEREIKYLEERYKVAWPVKFRAMLRTAHKLKKQFTPADYYYPNHLRSLLEKELDNLLSEALDPKHKEMIAFQKRITKYRDHVFTFLYHPTVPPDNNGSERAIRNVKVKQKISGQFKIFSAAENFAILISIIDTAIKTIKMC